MMTECDVCGKDVELKYPDSNRNTDKGGTNGVFQIRQTIHPGAIWINFGVPPEACAKGESERILGNYPNKGYCVCPECILRALGVKPKEE
jgi:hypothetical protein